MATVAWVLHALAGLNPTTEVRLLRVERNGEVSEFELAEIDDVHVEHDARSGVPLAVWLVTGEGPTGEHGGGRTRIMAGAPRRVWVPDLGPGPPSVEGVDDGGALPALRAEPRRDRRGGEVVVRRTRISWDARPGSVAVGGVASDPSASIRLSRRGRVPRDSRGGRSS